MGKNKSTLNEVKINEQKCIDCKKCYKACPMMKEYSSSPKELMKDIINEENTNLNIPYSCMLCGACDNKCPKDIEIKNMFNNLRKDIFHKKEKSLKNIGYNTVKMHQINSFSPLFSSNASKINSKKVFLPGCSLSSYSSDLVESTYEYLKDKLGDISLLIKCCGKPTEAMGDISKFEKYYSKLETIFKDKNIDEVIVACPSCFTTIKKYSPNIKVTLIWEIIREYGIPTELINHYANLDVSFSLHDPCPIRKESNIHNDVRDVLNTLGVKIIEFEKNRENSECCGSGGMVRATNPSISIQQTNKRANDAKGDIILSYCQSCCESMLIGKKKALHILDLIFNKDVINKNKLTQIKTSTLYKWSRRYKTNNLAKYNLKLFNLTISTLIILILGLIIFKICSMDIGSDDIKLCVDSFGNMAPIVYIIMFALVPLTLFPDSILAIAGGLAFGFIKGYIYTTIGALIGGSVSFYISRKLGRNVVKKLTKEKLDNIEEMINERGFFIVFLLRLIPLFPFDIISYGAGLTSINYKDFILATFLGTIPGIMVFTNIGAESLNIGSNSFYLSIGALILLFVSSIFLKKKLIINKSN